MAASLATPVRAQSPLPPVRADTLVVSPGSTVAYPRPLATGERIVVRSRSAVEAEDPGAGGRPVPDAPVGAVIARFGGGPPFAWPEGRTVWTAPWRGRLTFELNGRPAHRPGGRARVVVVRLTDAARAAFPAPTVDVERGQGGIVASYRDVAGFGLDLRTLALHVETSHGTRYRLAPWAPVGEERTVLPLPPPVSLPPGVHTISAEITDRLGNVARSTAVRFDGP